MIIGALKAKLECKCNFHRFISETA